MTTDPETALENMSLEQRVRAVRDDLDSGTFDFGVIDVFRLAELLEVPQPEMPENSWHFCTAVYISSVEDCFRDCDIEDVDEMCEWLEESFVDTDRLAEIRMAAEAAMKGKKPKFDFLDAWEREALQTRAAERRLASLVENGIGGSATYHVHVGGVSLWFRGAVEGDGACIHLEGPYDGIDGPDTRDTDDRYLCETW